MDIILYNIGSVIVLLIFGYLFGSIPNAVWIGKIFFHKDPRDYGSGNAGATNAGRVFGKKIGFLIIVLDSLKMIIPIYVAWIILIKAPINNGAPLMNTIVEKYVYGINDAVIKWPVYWITALGCSLGHCFPIFADFRGGKNASSHFGLTLAASWLICFGPGILYLVLLKAKKYVSLASILSSWLAVIISWTWAILILTGVINGSMVWLICYGPALECDYVLAIIITFSAGLLTYQHRGNIQRLRDGNERKITWMK